MNKLDFFQRLVIYDINGDTVSKKTFDAVKEIQEQNKILKEALEFYADKNNWDGDNIELGDTEIGYEVFNGMTLEYFEGGKRAREALAKVEE